MKRSPLLLKAQLVRGRMCARSTWGGRQGGEVRREVRRGGGGKEGGEVRGPRR